MKDGWKPILKSDGTYCSPRCGGGWCTKAAYDLAVAKGKALASSLGRPFKPVIWENLGWHFRAEVVTDDLDVSVHQYGRHFVCYLNSKNAPQFLGNGSTPQLAVGRAKRDVARHAAAVAALLAELP